MKLKLLAALLLASIIGVESAQAQIKGPKYDERLLFRGLTGVSLGAFQQEWKLDDGGAVLQQSVPMAISLPVTNRILLTLSNAPAIAKLDTSELQGIVDTRLAVSYVVPGDKLWINSGVSLPTGITKLDEKQFPVALMISQGALAYRVPVFGQGLNVNLGFAYAYNIQRRLVLGIGGSYLYKGEYQPVSLGGRTDKYKPGDEISANVGFDYGTLNRKTRFSADVTVTRYSPDKQNGNKFIQSGLRFMTIIVYHLKWGETVHLVQFRTRIRTQSEFFAVDPSQKYKSSQHYEFLYQPGWAVATWLTIGATLEGKMYTGDQIPIGSSMYETGKATVATAGGEIGLSLASWFGVSVGAKTGTGSMIVDNVKHSVTGLEMNGGVRIQF